MEIRVEPYGVQSSFEALGEEARCGVKACPYPGFGIVLWDHWSGDVARQFLCWNHFIIGASPFSMEYEDADALVGIPRHRSRSFYRDAVMKAGLVNHWTQARIAKFRSRGYSNKAATSAATHCAIRDGESTHYADPVYNVLGKVSSLMYSRCGEKVHSVMIVDRGADVPPTCQVCVRMLAEAIALLPPVPLKPKITTQPKVKQERLGFEELIVEGLLGSDSEAFINRRNWGERSGRTWKDRGVGVQKNLYRIDRGGVNRKRG